ncbi:hypothetical protein NQ318_012425 [Aromia moschata]|uniref:Uncharacterized protein n=1 Tax=Aromia moschata TaxID=1265417 RepID=A0AAV8Y2L9_9CUCU|nr:hypothetical protein NQ318_012425 [Aromia moschata]
MQLSFIILSSLAMACVTGYAYDKEDPYGEAPAQYQFEYGVVSPLTGDVKAQREQRDGKQVDGEYTLRESDGTTRLVQYKSTPHTGFEAIVQRAGVSIHPVLGQVFNLEGLNQAFGGRPVVAPKKAYGYGGYNYGGQPQGLGGHTLGGQGVGFQGFGDRGVGGLLNGLGNSFVGTTRWGNQGADHGYGSYGNEFGLGHGHGY